MELDPVPLACAISIPSPVQLPYADSNGLLLYD